MLESAGKMTVIEYDELNRAFGFLILKVMGMDLKTEDGKDVCPMVGFCEDCESCLLDRVMGVEPINGNVLTPLRPEWDKFTTELCIHLNLSPDENDHSNSCDGSFKISRNIIENRFPQFDVEATIDYFKKSEWYCDCEVFIENPVCLGESIKGDMINATEGL